VSGILRAGYPSGYLLASVVYGVLFTTIGWRGMFMVGAGARGARYPQPGR
jgi:SHS family lactate transporter-like MFS transporter